MTDSDKIKNIAELLHKKLGDINKETVREVDRSLVFELSEVAIEFLLYNFRKYDSAYNSGLMLTFANLWMKFKKEDWIELITKNFPRVQVQLNDFKLMNNDGNFTDLIFLHRYLKIDPICVLNDYVHVDKDQKTNCFRFCRIYNYKFFISENELIEDLTDFYDLELSKMNDYADRLVKEGFKKGFCSSEEFLRRLPS